MKSNLLACSITTDSSASFVGTENKMLHISDDEQHSIVQSSVDDSFDNTTTQQQKQSQGINNDNNNNSSRTLNTSATTTSNPQPSSPPTNNSKSSQPLSQSIIMEEHIALKLNVAQLHTELQTSQIQLNKYTMGLQQATSGLKSAQLAIGKLQSKNNQLVERNEELESENYYLLILLKNLIDEGGNGVGGNGGKGSLEEMLAPLKKNKGGVSSGKGKHIVKDSKKGKEVVGEDKQPKGWKMASTWWKDRSNRSSDDNKDDNDNEVLVVQGLPLIDNSDRGGAAGCGEGSKASGQSNKSSYKPGASVRSLKSSNRSSSGASGWWGGNNNRHRRSKSGGEASEGCGSSWHTSASGKGVREGETELLDEVPSTLIDKIRNLSVTLSRGSNMAVDSSKQKRGKCQVEGQDNIDDHPPVPEYVQWNDDRKIDYCSDVSFDSIIDDDQQVNTNIGKANEKEEGEKKEKEEYKNNTNLITYLKKNSGTSQQSQQQHETTDTNMEERQHANSAQYSLNPGDDDTYDPSEYEFSDC